MPFKFSDNPRRDRDSGNTGGGRRERRFEDNSGDEHFRKLFVGGLSYETTKEDLEKHFGEYGIITDSVVMIYPDSKRSRGFGFITFETISSVDAVQDARPHVIDSREVETKRATPRDRNLRGDSQLVVKKIFMGGIMEQTTEDDIRAAVEEYGRVTEIDVLKHRDTGKPRGFCFVTFDDTDPVDKVCMKGWVTLQGRKVEVKKATPKEGERRDSRFGSGGDRRGGGRDNSFGDRGDRFGSSSSGFGSSGFGSSRFDRSSDRYSDRSRDRYRSRSPVSRSYDYGAGSSYGGGSSYTAGASTYGTTSGYGGGSTYGSGLAASTFAASPPQNDALANLTQLAPALASLGTLVGLLSNNAGAGAGAGGANVLSQLVSALGGATAPAPVPSPYVSQETTSARPSTYGDRETSSYNNTGSSGYSSNYNSGFGTSSYSSTYGSSGRDDYGR